MKKQLKLVLTLGLLSTILAMIIVFNIQDKDLKVFFLDVGQGDAILIRTPNHQDILIDGGPDNTLGERIGHFLPFYDRDIELMILTHAHADHLIGLIEVLKRYRVDQILYSGRLDYEAGDYQAWLNIIEQKSVPLQVTQCCEKIALGENLSLEILHPFEDFSGKKVEDLNDTSVVTRLVFHNVEFMFTGDAPIEVEKELIDKNLNLDSDVLKVGHHGSKESSSLDFIKRVQPKYAAIQSGEDNQFGHPHFRTLSTLAKEKVEVFRNDFCGDIIFKTDGIDIEINSQKCERKK